MPVDTFRFRRPADGGNGIAVDDDALVFASLSSPPSHFWHSTRRVFFESIRLWVTYEDVLVLRNFFAVPSGRIKI